MGTLTDRREVRNGAREVKFLVPAAVVDAVKVWARSHLAADPHGVGAAGDEYRTTSLYVDTMAQDVFNRRGSFARAKLRVRRYGSADVVFLERKLRTRRQLVKRRTGVPLSDLGRLQAASNGDWVGGWFQRRLSARWLEPACQIGYTRTARVLESAAGMARLTIDTDIRASLVDRFAFADDPGLAVLTDLVIVEMKYSGSAPALFRQCIEALALSPAPVSKYRLAMGRLGQTGSDGATVQGAEEPLCA